MLGLLRSPQQLIAPRSTPPPECLPVIRLTSLDLNWIPIAAGCNREPSCPQALGNPRQPSGLRTLIYLPFLLCRQHPCWFLWSCLPTGAPAGTHLLPTRSLRTFPSLSPSLVELSLALPQHVLLCPNAYSTLKTSSSLFTWCHNYSLQVCHVH